MSVITNLNQRIKYLLLFFVILNCLPSFAQLFSFDNYSVKDGLVQSNVRGIAQDSYGNIWLGTDGGLSKFDGNTFQNYFSSDSIVGDNVSTLFKDRNEIIWIGYMSGNVTRYNNTIFEVMKSDVFPKGNKVLTIIQDSKNSLWISFQNFGVVKIIDPTADWNNSKNYKIYKTREGLSAVVVNIVETKNNDLYFVTDIGIKHFLNDENAFEFFKVKGFEGVQVTGMLEDTEGNLWISYYLGGPGMLLRTNPKTNEVQTFMLTAFVSHLISDDKGNVWGATWGNGIIKYDIKKNKLISFNAANGLGSEKNYCLMQDREGNIFVGSQNNGFYIFKGERFVTYNALSGLAGEQVNAVTADAKNNLWMGTNTGLSKLNTEDNIIQNYEKANGTAFHTRTLAKDKSGNLWIGTSNQKLIHYNVETNKFSPVSLVNNFISSTIVNTLVFDKSDKLWVGTIGSGLSVFDPSKGNAPKCFTVDDGFYGQSVTINALLCDHNGNMWVAVEGRGLVKYENGTFKLFSKEYSLSKSIITSLAEDATGNIWIGTSGDGAFVYTGKLFQHINTKDGLLSNLVNSIAVDENTNVWIGTNKGLSKYISKDSVFISYVKKDGFSSIETKPNAVFANKKGTIWFGTVNGLIKYNAEYDYLNTCETQLTITNVKVNYTESLDLNKQHELAYNKNTITFNYSGVCISNPDAVKYSVMLSGDEENWRPISAEKMVIYSNLSPGNYIFKVKASNNLGIWNKEPVTFSFRINPPWYFTWWAYITYIMFGGGGGF